MLLTYLPEHLRNAKAVSVLRFYVGKGKANTLEQARSLYAKDLLEMDERERIKEEREERERQYRETQESLRTIAQNQEKIHDDLKEVNRELHERGW